MLQVLALPPPTAGPPPPPPPPPGGIHPGMRPPFIPSTGVGNVPPPLGVGRGVMNGGPNLATSQPSVADITAGAMLIASVVQGQCTCTACLYTVSKKTTLMLHTVTSTHITFFGNFCIDVAERAKNNICTLNLIIRLYCDVKHQLTTNC